MNTQEKIVLLAKTLEIDREYLTPDIMLKSLEK